MKTKARPPKKQYKMGDRQLVSTGTRGSAEYDPDNNGKQGSRLGATIDIQPDVKLGVEKVSRSSSVRVLISWAKHNNLPPKTKLIS